ncbi:ribonuclease P protein component [Trueperella bialowiezensis]|uniref:Ribonuclease P protein component n=1 Tax=Trueperella bialowiezensis TaxID=312285 RepID=A0A3S4Z5E7_9ACTO|nr:ribonuclease P protein component [Trueperella bialowiezensis]VEI13346.1 Ribonuclease P protein component [Trueperella bialowiezensis]
MLPAVNRMRRTEDFRFAARTGLRRANRYFVLHVVEGEPGAGLLVGFTVSKKVGNAVVRNQVRRRLRHIMRDYLDIPAAMVVIRALPASAGTSSSVLRTALHKEFVALGLADE